MRYLGLSEIFLLLSKKVLLYLEHYLTLFLVLFSPKTSKEKIGIFLPIAWVNPFGKMGFLRLWKIWFLYSKKVSFLFRTLLNLISSLILTNTKIRENWHFLTKSMGYPLWKNAILGLWKIWFLYSTKVSFLSRTLLNLISSLILTKTKIRENWHFLTNSMG